MFEAEFDKLDINGDGSVDRAELKRAVLENDTMFASSYTAAINEFFLADANHDNKVTKEEFLTVIRNLTDIREHKEINCNKALAEEDKTPVDVYSGDPTRLTFMQRKLLRL